MSIFATLYATEPATPREALRMAFPGSDIVDGTPPRVTTPGVDASSWVPSPPSFHEELIGFAPAVLVYFVLDKFDTVTARRDLSAAVRSFLRSSRGDVVLCYLDDPILKRDAGGSWYKSSYDDFVDGQEWVEVPRVEIPRDEEV
jgi:hypothetical protein